MSAKIQLVLILLIVMQVIAEEKIQGLKEVVEFQTKNKDGELIRLFSLKDIPAAVREKEWYAFLELEVAENNFVDKVYVELSTVSIATKTSSDPKVKCENFGQHLSDCFIGSNQINPETEYLQVKLNLMNTLTAKMYIQIDEVKSLEINEAYLLEKGVPTFSRIVRLDLNSLPNKFNYLICEMKALNQKPDFNQLFYFLMAKEQTPPNHYRYSQASQSLWGKNQQGGYTFLQLEQTQYLTLTIQIVGASLYEMKCTTVGGGSGKKQTVQLQPNKSYYELYIPNKAYHLKLPQLRKPNIYYMVSLETTQLGQLSFVYLKLNNKAVVTQDLKKMGGQTNFFTNDGQIQLWLNETYSQVEFQVRLINHLIFTIVVEEYNIDMIELREERPWIDSLQTNQTEYFFFTISSQNSDSKAPVSFDVQLRTQNKNETSELDLKFYLCTQKTIQLCHHSAHSNDTLSRKVALSSIVPKVKAYPQHKKFSFSKLFVTKYQMGDNNYQSIIMVEVAAKKQEVYSLIWHSFKPQQYLKQNKIVRGYLNEKAIHTLYFSVIDTRKIHFARIDFLFEGRGQIFISTSSIDFQSEVMPNWGSKELYYHFQNSITIPNVKSMKNYYVYLYGDTQGSYRLRLSYGYNQDDNSLHPISYLTVGQRYKSEVTLQPAQVVFIEVRTKQLTYLTLQNSITLKFCYLTTTQMPTSHKQVLNSTYCNNFKTENNYLIGNYNSTGKSYVAIENEQTVPVLLKLTTEVEVLGCFPVQMGEKMLISKLGQIKGGCITYQITHRGEIQVTSDLTNPQMQGMTHPIISIGKEYKSKMNSNIKIIKADEIDLACKGEYDDCYLKVTLQPTKTNTTQVSISIFVSYTNRPLMLSDGIGHPAQLAKGEVKHFKYPLILASSIFVALKQHEYLDEYTIYAKLVTIKQKFHYPDSQEYQRYLNAQDRTNLSEVFVSKTKWLVGTPNMKIAQEKIKKYCKDQFQSQCYLLLSVQNTQHLKGEFTIQVTQTVHNIKLGYTQNAYLSKGDFDYFNFYNIKPNASVLFLISSHASVCHKVGLYEGNIDITKALKLEHQSEVLLQKSKQGWYTVVVQATDDCFYSIQASSSEKQIAQLTFGYGAPLHLKTGEKRYFLIRNQNLDKIKLIGGIDRNLTAEMILRAVPVTDNEMPDFIKFMNGEIEIGKKSRLDYAWTHTNHLAMRSTDPKYCKECFICLQVEAVGDVSGFLALSSSNLQNMQMNRQSLMYDILLKEETFSWIFRYISVQSLIDINLQAGAVRIQIYQSDAKLLQQHEIKYDKFNTSNNKVTFKINHSLVMSYISIKITAIQNSDYNVINYIQKNSTKADQTESIEIGRPKNIIFTNNNTHCIKGRTNDDPTDFVLILKDNHYARGAIDTDQQARLVAEKLVVNATVNGKVQKMKVERVKHNFLISFQDKISIINKTYTICFSVPNDTTLYKASLMLLGNLNYFSQNEAIHIRRGANLTFMSDGRGVIQIDECSSRATLVLSTKYDGLMKSTSNLNHRRVVNNYITFNHIGPVYMGAHTDDFVTLRWKNYHPTSLNGYGYDYFSASTFRLHQSKTQQQLSLTIKPLIVQQPQKDKKNLPELLQIVYDIYIAKQQADLYNGMNCERGEFMHFMRKVTDKEGIAKELLVQLNNLQDLMKTFRSSEYVLITVKASLDVKWKNNIVQNYRFYYPYQQLMLQQRPIIDEQKIEQSKADIHNFSSSAYIIVITILLFVLVAIVVAALLIYLRRRYRSPRLMQQDLPNVSSAFDYKQSTELPERSHKKI